MGSGQLGITGDNDLRADGDVGYDMEGLGLGLSYLVTE